MGVLKGWVQPEVVVVWSKDYRHPVVNVGQERIWRRSEDRAALDYIALRVSPSIPEASESEQFAFTHFEAVRLFRLSFALPLVKAISWNEASLRFEGFSK
jgi:hypothetical protein